MTTTHFTYKDQTKRFPDGITRAVLSNGLTVIAKEMHASPVTAFCVCYRVGSRNEHGGISLTDIRLSGHEFWTTVTITVASSIA